MIEMDQKIAEQLSDVSLNSAIQVRCGTSNSFTVSASIIHPLTTVFEMAGVYISASRAADEVIEGLEAVGISTSGIQFLDMVSSGIHGGTNTTFENVTYIDSPIMLESALLQTMYYMRTTSQERNFVFLDSVNALAIYNEERMLAEYLHTFVNTFRQREVLSIILNVPDQTPPGVLANLDLYCSDLIDRGQIVIN